MQEPTFFAEWAVPSSSSESSAKPGEWGGGGGGKWLYMFFYEGKTHILLAEVARICLLPAHWRLCGEAQ